MHFVSMTLILENISTNILVKVIIGLLLVFIIFQVLLESKTGLYSLKHGVKNIKSAYPFYILYILAAIL